MIQFQRRSLKYLFVFRQHSLLLLFSVLPLFVAQAQSDVGRVYGSVDRDVAMPRATGIYGHVDSAAMAEISSYKQVVGASPWQGMSGKGTITYQQGKDSEVDEATFTILNADSYRLDVQRPQGNQSTRIRGMMGAMRTVDGRTLFLAPQTATQGIIEFPQLLSAEFPNNQISILDKGILTVDGKSMHHISLERPLYSTSQANASISPAMKLSQDIVTDLYFDAATHLLLRSVAMIRLPGARSTYLKCISYDDYRRYEGVLVPFRYTETLNGQLQWVLQLNQVQFSPNLTQADFMFRNNSQ